MCSARLIHGMKSTGAKPSAYTNYGRLLATPRGVAVPPGQFSLLTTRDSCMVICLVWGKTESAICPSIPPPRAERVTMAIARSIPGNHAQHSKCINTHAKR